ncbi:conserved Plasmodium protein, unknown function [Plasmodium ovale wallikeri]|uniref:Heptatricopeptide repeat-containing protein n=1 Tax=Plasmodium ovale wallikeri TaxID=864142 RepID=A0A1A8YRE4_PLAOA|nr:conserved Plasmodium protein, unknown function [Plasmodium ovale wallikeri]
MNVSRLLPLCVVLLFTLANDLFLAKIVGVHRPGCAARTHHYCSSAEHARAYKRARSRGSSPANRREQLCTNKCGYRKAPFLVNNGKLFGFESRGKTRKSVIRVAQIKDFDSLVGGHVLIRHGKFKGCQGVILDFRKTDKVEYECLVVINRDQFGKYPKNILNNFGKSYWFNIKFVEMKKLKNLFFHNYDNFYQKREDSTNVATDPVEKIGESFSDLEEVLLSADKASNVVSDSSSGETSNVVSDSSSGEITNTVANSSSGEITNTVAGQLLSGETSNGVPDTPTGASELVQMQESYLKGRKRRYGSEFCHSVVKEIEKNYLSEDLLNMYREKRHLSNIVVCFYILRQLLRIYNFEKDDEKLRNRFVKNVIHSHTFEIILIDIKNFLEKKEIYRVVDKTWLLWVLVKLNVHKDYKYKSLFEPILHTIVNYLNYNILKKLNTKSLCAILWSLAKSSYNINLKVYRKILYFLQKYINVLTSQDISNIYYSLSLINYKDENFLKLIEEEIKKNINKFTIQSLMNILWAMIKHKRNNNIFSIVKDKLLFYSTNLDIRNMSLFLWCLNKNHYYKVDISFEGKQFKNINIKQAMQLLLFFIYNKNKYIEYLKYILHFLFENIAKLTNKEISFFTYSLSKLNILNKSFSKLKKNILLRDYTTLNVIDINMIFLSLNNSNIYDKTVINYLLCSLKNVLNYHISDCMHTRRNGTLTQTELPSGHLVNGEITNLNYIVKNLSEMKLLDQSAFLKYVFFYAHSRENINANELMDFLFYIISIIPPEKGVSYVQDQLKKKSRKCEERYAGLIINNNEIKLKEGNFQKLYLHYLRKIIFFLKRILLKFEAKSFLTHCNHSSNGKNEYENANKEKGKPDKFVFNYHSDTREDVEKLNELVLDNSNIAPDTSALGKLISNEEFFKFVHHKEGETKKGEVDNVESGNGESGNGESGNGESGNVESDNDESGKVDSGNGDAFFPCMNSLLHLFYSLAYINAFDKKDINFHFDNLYDVVNDKKNEITAYQWLLIRDTIKIVKLKKKKKWEVLLDNVNTYSTSEEEPRDYFETIHIDI